MQPGKDLFELTKEEQNKKDYERVKDSVEKMSMDNWADAAKPLPEKIDGPEHYNGYQVIDAIWEAGYGEDFCLGNAVKYILRAKKKDNKVEDIKKAEWYLKYYLDHKIQ